MHEEHAEDVIRHHAQRALGSRARLRLLAVTAWTSFLGAIPILIVWIALAPPERHLGIAGVSVLFFAAWVCAAIPTSMAVLLTHPRLSSPPSPDRAHGR